MQAQDLKQSVFGYGALKDRRYSFHKTPYNYSSGEALARRHALACTYRLWQNNGAAMAFSETRFVETAVSNLEPTKRNRQ